MPVLLAVVRGSLDGQRPLIEETFRWCGDKPVLHILDTVAWDALQQLAQAGMITINVRARRPLLPAESQATFSSEEPTRIADVTAAESVVPSRL